MKVIKSSTAEMQNLVQVAPSKYNDVKKDIKQNAMKHNADAAQNTEDIKKLKAENNLLMAESNEKTKQLDDVRKAMEGLTD